MPGSVYSTYFDGTKWTSPGKLFDGANAIYSDIDLPQIASSTAKGAYVTGSYRTNSARDELNPLTRVTQTFPLGTAHVFEFTGINDDVKASPIILDGNTFIQTARSPKITAYDSVASIFYQVQNNDLNSFWSLQFDNKTEKFRDPAWLLVSGRVTPYPPAVAFYRGLTHLFSLSDARPVIDHWVNSRERPDDYTRSNVVTAVGVPFGLPAVAVYQGCLCVCYYTSSAAGSTQLILQRSIGNGWSIPIVVEKDALTTAGRPSLTTLGGLLYCFYVAEGHRNKRLAVRYRTFDGNSFSQNRTPVSDLAPATHDVDTTVRTTTVTDSATGNLTTDSKLYCIFQSEGR